MDLDTQKTGKYLLIGDLCMDIFMQVDAYPAAGGDGTVRAMHQHAGGSAANTALALAKLGGQPHLLTHTGEDIWAQQLIPLLKQEGVRTHRIVRERGEATGLTFLVVSSDAERTMFTYRGANPHLHPDEILPELFTDIDFLHVSSYACLQSPQSEAVHKAIQLANHHKVPVSLDVGVEPAERARGFLLELLSGVNLLILSDSEAIQLTQKTNIPEALDVLVQSGVQLIALKLGEKGCRLMSQTQDIYIPSFEIVAIDTTGAGDSFCAGMIHGLTQSWSLDMAGQFANAMGALAASRWGAGEKLPSLKEIREFLSAHKKSLVNPNLPKYLTKMNHG